MWEMRVQSLGWEDALEEGIATRSSILPGKSHGQRNSHATVHGVTKDSDTTWQLNNIQLYISMCNIYQSVCNVTIIIAIILFEPQCMLGPSVVFKNIISFYSQNNYEASIIIYSYFIDDKLRHRQVCTKSNSQYNVHRAHKVDQGYIGEQFIYLFIYSTLKILIFFLVLLRCD